MEKQNKSPCEFQVVAVPTILILLSLLIFVIYPIIIGISLVSLNTELSQLNQKVQHVETRNALVLPNSSTHDTQTGSQTGCKCAKQTSDVHQTPLHEGNHAKIRENLLQCCSADEENIKTIIKDEVRKKSAKNRQEKQEVTLENVKKSIQRIMHKYSTDSQLPSIADTSSGFAACHVTGSPGGFTANKDIRGERGKFMVGQWESTYGQAFTYRVEIDKHHIIAPKSGIYYIYSQVYFRDERDDKQRNRMNVNEYLHYTVLDSTSYAVDPVTLMKSGRTQEGETKPNYYYSSYHSGLFRLREGDKIYMKVYLPSKLVKLDSHQESTFMGMYLVNED